MTRRGNTMRGRFARLWESCRGRLLAALRRRAGPPAALSIAPRDRDYDDVLDKVFGGLPGLERHLRVQEAQARKILAWFESEDEVKVAAELPSHFGMYARFLALLERSWAIRHDNPQRMLLLAGLAYRVSIRLKARRYGCKQTFDFQCRAQAAVANALRVAQRLDEAAAAMGRARELFELGTRDLSLEIFLLEREAPLDVARRRFHEAAARLKKVYRGYRSLGDKHLAGKALVQLGICATYAGHPEEALAILRRSLALIEDSRDPDLAFAAMQTQVWILCDCGRFREAERQLFELRPLQTHQGGRINQLKLRWLEGRVDAGLERLERAERTFLEVRDGMTAAGRAYDAALASLDLAGVLLGRGNTRQAREVMTTAYEVFLALGVNREALVSIAILHYCLKAGLATRLMVERVAAELRKLESDPEAKR